MTPMKALMIALLLGATASCTPAPGAPGPAAPLPPTASEQAEARTFEAPPAEAAETEARAGEGQLGPAPGGSLVRSDGKSIDVASLYAERGAVVVFYRGHWCKPCRAQLEDLQKDIDKFTARGFAIHAISTDDPADSAELKQKLGLAFHLYSDQGGLASNAWSVYSAEHGLARPAVFVVRPGGIIAAKFVTETPTHRPPMEDLLAQVEQASAIE